MQQVHDVPSVVPGTPRSRTATIPARAFLQASRDEKCRDRHGANAGKESRTAGRCYAGKGIADCGAQGQAETMLGAEPIHLEDRVSDGGVEERRVTLRAYQAAGGGLRSAQHNPQHLPQSRAPPRRERPSNSGTMSTSGIDAAPKQRTLYATPVAPASAKHQVRTLSMVSD